MHESVSACLITAANPLTTSENNASARHPKQATDLVPAPVHAVVHANHSYQESATHVHAGALPEDIRATHNTASAAHVHAHLEVEVEMEQEREQEVEKEVKVKKSLGVNTHIVAQTRHCRGITSIFDVFNYWKTIWQHPKAVLDKKRYRLIAQALQQGYTVSQLCDAISGCAQTPHNRGENDRGQCYDGLHIILRDADQIERFIHNCHNPPRPPNPVDQLVRANATVGENWLKRKQNSGDFSHEKR